VILAQVSPTYQSFSGYNQIIFSMVEGIQQGLKLTQLHLKELKDFLRSLPHFDKNKILPSCTLEETAIICWRVVKAGAERERLQGLIGDAETSIVSIHGQENNKLQNGKKGLRIKIQKEYYTKPSKRRSFMKTILKAYDPSKDFLRIRDFLIDTFTLYKRPFNWLIDRWNFVRYFGVPVHSYYNVQYFGVPTRTYHSFRDELPFWEERIGIWENEDGDIVGVVNTDNEEPGEAFIQIHPDFTFLYDEMVTYIEEHLADRVGNIGYVKLYINEGTELEQIARERGYRKLGRGIPFLEYTIDEIPEPQLPEGFVIKSVLDEDDVEKRRTAKAIAFGGHYGPSYWPPASAYKKMQQAPDYRKDLDLFIVAPNGDYASFCTIWIDVKNKYGNFEPVGTHIEYQGMGLGRALLMEGFRRMMQYGATRSFMDSNNEFYRKVGFRETLYSYYPWIKYFAV